MQMNRRLEKLEAVSPENIDSYRVMFKHEGEPNSVIDPPLKPNEQPIIVTFVASQAR